jgi:hypothetical protein
MINPKTLETRKRRITAKKRIVKAMGGKCVICGYNKCVASLCLHHRNSMSKEMEATDISIVNMLKELPKTVLVCSNCHAEIHAGIATVPDNTPCDIDYLKSLPNIVRENSSHKGIIPWNKGIHLSEEIRKRTSDGLRRMYNERRQLKNNQVQELRQTI